jgi:Flp pilus assembly secretin CpaC
LEIEPTLSDDNKLIDLRIVPEMVYHVGDKIISEWKGEQGDASIKMPLFYTMRLNTSVTMMDGQTLFVAALSPKDAEGQVDPKRKVMVFFRCDVLEVGR